MKHTGPASPTSAPEPPTAEGRDALRRSATVAGRRKAIELLARDQGVVTVAHLACVFGVSAVTIRSDLTALVATGAVRRFHGGALGTPVSDALG